jgi:hypothetical protein
MVSFRLPAARRRRCGCASGRGCSRSAESLGGVESLIEHPGRMTHASAAGSPLEVPGDLVRLSVGIEDVDDLLADLDLATAEHRTTIDTDVLDGYDACLAALVAADAGRGRPAVLACSSAGGGLRIAVVGNEELVTAEAGRRVALSSGGKGGARRRGGLGDDLAERAAGQRARRRAAGRAAPTAATPRSCLRARALAAAAGAGPVVVAGNVDARDEVAGSWRPARRTSWPTTSSRGSACWHPTRPARRSARCSCGT